MISRPQALLDSGLRDGRLKHWPGTRSTATEDIIRDGGVTVGRCRDAIRNYPWARKAVDAWSSAVIGVGIKPSPRIDSKAVRKRLLEDWRDWTDEADADGRTDLYGLQRLAARELMAAGEVFFRRRVRRASDGYVVPLQIQCISSEQLPAWLHSDDNSLVGTLDIAPGNTIRAGIEFDGIGRRVAYHFLRQHPGESIGRGSTVRNILSDPNDLVRVPAEDIIHVYDTEEPGQVRGMPRMAAGIIRLYEAERFIDAQCARQHIASCIALVVSPPIEGLPAYAKSPEETPADEVPQTLDPSGRVLHDLDLSPGLLIQLKPGEEWRPLDPPQLTGEFDKFMYRVLCDIAVAFGVPYLALTGDAEKADYSSERAVHVRWWREIEPIQHHTFVHQLCRPVWSWFIEAGAMAGTLRLPGMARSPRKFTRLDWITHKWEWVDPLKDGQALKLQMEMGITSREHVQDQLGLDPEQEDESILASQERAERLGLKIGADAQVPAAEPEPTEEGSENRDQQRQHGEDDGEEE